MNTNYMGNVLVLGNNIDTDQIYPGRFLDITDPKEIGNHCLSGINPKFASEFVKGDIIVAGTNFGCGSSREHAPIALIHMGVSVILADSFARIFFRNAINLGLPLIVCNGISKKVKDGQKIAVELMAGTVTIPETGEIIRAESLGNHALKILEAGGIKPMMQARL